jgi:type VI secretion system protein ImpA
LLAESADLRIACWLLRARIKCGDLRALFAGVDRLASLMEENIYPHPIADEGHPSSSHASALAWFGTTRCLLDFHATRISDDHPAVLGDLLDAPDGRTLQAMARSHDLSTLGDDLRACANTLEAIEQRVNEHASGYMLNAEPLRSLLEKAASVWDACVPKHAAHALPEAENVETASAVEPLFACRSRAEAHRMIDALVAYFQASEPSHPAPIFLRRIQKTIGMDFEGIVNELIPEAGPGLSRLTGT